MYLEQNILDQLRTLFAELRHSYTLLIERPAGAKGDELLAMITDFVSVSDRLTLEDKASDRLRLTLLRDGQKTGITFRAIPSGHEFTSLILAVLNADGQGRNLPDEAFIARIQALNTPLKLTTYASLTCTNCPEVVQSLNLLALYNEGIEHEMVDGAIYTEEVERLGISSVPAVYMGQELIHVGKATLGELLLALEQRVGSRPTELEGQRRELDLVVVGAGPAGIASAIYSARKGLRVAVVAERIGGQVNETTGIEIVRRAVEEPLRQIVANAGKEGAVIVQRVKEGQADFGYNARTDSFENLYASGVIDPAKVARVALENAASIAGMFLTTECVIADKKEDTPAMPMNPGMGGMGGMM